jgi:hypothetical protein
VALDKEEKGSLEKGNESLKTISVPTKVNPPVKRAISPFPEVFPWIETASTVRKDSLRQSGDHNVGGATSIGF